MVPSTVLAPRPQTSCEPLDLVFCARSGLFDFLCRLVGHPFHHVGVAILSADGHGVAEMTLDGPQVRSLAEVVDTYDRVAVARLALDDDCKQALLEQVHVQLATPVEFAKADAVVAGLLALGVRAGAMGESDTFPDCNGQGMAAAICSTWIVRALDVVCSDCRPRISWPTSTGRLVLPGHVWASDDVREIIDLRRVDP